MNNLENRVDKLERQSVVDSGGREMVVKFKDGTVTRFSEGKAPFQTITLTVAYDQTEEQGKKYERLMKALFNGERT